MKNQAVIFDAIVPHPEPVNIAELLTDIEAVIKRHVILGDHAAAALAVWVLHTWTFELRDTVAYVAIESPEKRCGKTTLLSVLAAMAHKPLIASNVTVGALFRAIDTCRPTLFIDEADTFLAGNGTMRGIINSGNTWRTAYVLRLSRSKQSLVERAVTLAPIGGEGRGEGAISLHGGATAHQLSTISHQPTDSGLKKYSCWCPKVIAMIGQVPDTIADRSIVVPMSRKLTTETCAPLAELNTTEIKAKCARFAADMSPFIREAGKIHSDGLNDRASDTFDPLFVITRLAGQEWEMKLRAAALNLAATAQSQQSGAELLSDIVSIFILSSSEKIFSRNLVKTLRDGQGLKSFALKYSSLNEYRIAQILRYYGIKSANIRIGSEVGKGYNASDFRDAIARYVPAAEAQARIEELRSRVQLQTEANAEAKKEAALMDQVLAQAIKNRIQTPSEAEALLRSFKVGEPSANDNVADCSGSCSGNVAD